MQGYLIHMSHVSPKQMPREQGGNIGAPPPLPHVILKIYKVYPYTIYFKLYSIGVDLV